MSSNTGPSPGVQGEGCPVYTRSEDKELGGRAGVLSEGPCVILSGIVKGTSPGRVHLNRFIILIHVITES